LGFEQFPQDLHGFGKKFQGAESLHQVERNRNWRFLIALSDFLELTIIGNELAVRAAGFYVHWLAA
jgi:hypothetical protein